jgi:two-component system KDP operon response regulator KdpE
MSPGLSHVLVAAEEGTVRHALRDSLTAAGFSFQEVDCSRDLLEIVYRESFDLVVLAFKQPDVTGFEYCRRLRALSSDLKIVLIGTNATASYEVLALDAGADDCIGAPFRFRELMARLSAVLHDAQRAGTQHAPVVRAGDIELNVPGQQCRRAGADIHLSRREFDLLLFLMKNQETALTHTKLLRAVWGGAEGDASGRVRSCVNALRRKIEQDPTRPRYLLTEPWVGYRFRNPDLPAELRST